MKMLLLKKYMAQVIDREGISFIPGEGYQRGGAPEFTKEEIDILEKLEDEIQKENS